MLRLSMGVDLEAVVEPEEEEAEEKEEEDKDGEEVDAEGDKDEKTEEESATPEETATEGDTKTDEKEDEVEVNNRDWLSGSWYGKLRLTLTSLPLKRLALPPFSKVVIGSPSATSVWLLLAHEHTRRGLIYITNALEVSGVSMRLKPQTILESFLAWVQQGFFCRRELTAGLFLFFYRVNRKRPQQNQRTSFNNSRTL